VLDAPGAEEPEEAPEEAEEEVGELEEDGPWDEEPWDEEPWDEEPWDEDSGDEDSGDGAVADEVDGAEDVSDTGADGVSGGVSELVGVVAVDGERGAGVATAGCWKTDVSSGGRAGIGTGSTIGAGATGAGAAGAGAAGAGAGAGAAGAGGCTAGAAGTGAAGWAAGGATNTVRGASWTTGIGAWMVSGVTATASCTADGVEV